MKTPILLIGAALIFWGWQTGWWFLALPMAILFEISPLINWRLDLSDKNFKSIGNFCGILLLLSFIYFLLVKPSLFFIYTLVQWLPWLLFPLLLAQTYSTSDYLDLKLFFLFPNLLKNAENTDITKINLTYPYFAICIFSTSAVHAKNLSFYVGMYILVGIAFWCLRSKRFSPRIWISLILLAGMTGFIMNLAISQSFQLLEISVVQFLSKNNGQLIDPLKKNTSIGEIGLLKQSNDIIFRVASEQKITSPLLLREATYNKYLFSNWLALKAKFIPIQPDHETTWHLGEKPRNSSQINISATLLGGKGLLKLADSSFEINNLAVTKMEKNQYGTVQVEGKFESISYQVQFNHDLSLDSPPNNDDLQIPAEERPAIKEIIKQLHIQDQSSQKILPQLQSFFEKNFTYSLNLSVDKSNLTPLSGFLLKTRSGHCEYFATATALLLRALGIPTRYAIGYSVHEFSPLENQYIVRSRHAHAWTMVYLDGKWTAFDTTPGDWTRIEDESASKLAFISDLWSLITFKFSGWWRDNDKLIYLVLLLPLGLIIVRSLGLGKPGNPLKRISRKPIAKIEQNPPKSEFYLIELELSKLGLNRHSSESLRNWVQRLKTELPVSDFLDDLTSIIELYYRDRFDPKGIIDPEKVRLKSAIKSWIDKYKLDLHNK